MRHEKFTATITCPKCGQNGIAVWEEIVSHENKGTQLEMSLPFLSAGFRRNDSELRDANIACERCGTIIEEEQSKA